MRNAPLTADSINNTKTLPCSLRTPVACNRTTQKSMRHQRGTIFSRFGAFCIFLVTLGYDTRVFDVSLVHLCVTRAARGRASGSGVRTVEARIVNWFGSVCCRSCAYRGTKIERRALEGYGIVPNPDNNAF